MKKDRTMDYATAAFRDYAAGLQSTSGQAADADAVRKMLAELKGKGRQDVIAAVEAVYFVEADKPLRGRNISERALRFAVSYPADISTVYRWLKEARRIFAEYRGLTK